jgi:hypothetical protein
MISTVSAPIDRPLRCILLALSLLVAAAPAWALRVVDYNILNYPGSSGTVRAPYYRTILAPLHADVIATEEMSSPTGPSQFLNEVLNVMEPGEWATVPFIDGNDTDASIFYKPAKVSFLGQWAFYPNPANQLRLVHVYRIKPIEYVSAAAELRLYTAHLKASTGYESQRLAECVGLRDSMNAMPAGTHALICGDLNFYTQAAEPGYAKLLESQANNTGRVYDLLPAGAWHDGAAFAPYHTQSPCLNGTCASGAATGGLDDRFDFILPTYALITRHGLAVIPNTCIPVGNDGHHLNLNITDTPVIPEGGTYAIALKLASDHLPLRIDLQLPAQIVADGSLAFGTVIVDATGQALDLNVSNPAEPPADSLNCILTPPAGFDSPSALAVAAGEAASVAITLDTTESGSRFGDLMISSDAPDNPTVLVGLSGTVLDHAIASLDSTTVVHNGAVNFGDHEVGGFATLPVGVYNVGFNPLQARLSLNDGVIVGGSGRFSLVGGFTSHLISGAGQHFLVAFDDSGAVSDSTYTALLTFSGTDEPLPGATVQPDLTVSLRARIIGGQSDVTEQSVPIATRLFAPSPNPLLDRTSVRLDLARPAEINLAVFDPSGRLVATLHRGPSSPGRHTISWDGRDDSGSHTRSGVYFLRLSGTDLPAQSLRLVVVR